MLPGSRLAVCSPESYSEEKRSRMCPCINEHIHLIYLGHFLMLSCSSFFHNSWSDSPEILCADRSAVGRLVSVGITASAFTKSVGNNNNNLWDSNLPPEKDKLSPGTLIVQIQISDYLFFCIDVVILMLECHPKCAITFCTSHHIHMVAIFLWHHTQGTDNLMVTLARQWLNANVSRGS